LIGQAQIIGIAKPDVDALLRVVLYQLWRVVHGNNSVRVLLREPTSPRANVYNAAASSKVFLI